MGMWELLRRFRPAGTPGAAAPAAVPANPEQQAAAELGPVFNALAAARAEAAGIRASAAHDAEERERSAAAEAGRIIAAAQDAARSVRDEAFSLAQRDVERTGAALVTAAREQAAGLRARDPDALDRAADAVVRAALAAIGAAPGPAPDARTGSP
ncbi:hypothetical protein [Dactylosporangium sp. CA-092794]|uniref:hypothetical protein n=1 Tax=Dactylosporangium sp. CA-092794 TaxID=3239929 RepID=UPI003D8DBD90